MLRREQNRKYTEECDFLLMVMKVLINTVTFKRRPARSRMCSSLEENMPSKGNRNNTSKMWKYLVYLRNCTKSSAARAKQSKYKVNDKKTVVVA